MKEMFTLLKSEIQLLNPRTILICAGILKNEFGYFK